MIIKNINIFTEDNCFRKGYIYIKDEIIDRIVFEDEMDNLLKDYTNAIINSYPEKICGGYENENIIDGDGGYLIPGLIDIHLHGAMGYDACDMTYEALERIAEYEIKNGIMNICLATMTLEKDELKQVLANISGYVEKCHNEIKKENTEVPRASIEGINMEGPFISREKCGAQDINNIVEPSKEVFDELYDASNGMIRFAGLAPEVCSEEIANEYIKYVSGKTVVSLTHSATDYDRAMSAIKSGASHVTHLYNAMQEFTHREPAIFGAVSDTDVSAELICDGIHVHPSAVRMAFKILSDDRIVLISDSMRATGLKDGVYSLGGKDVLVSGKKAVLAEDSITIAGSVTNLTDCMINCVKNMGVPLNSAVKASTINPATVLNISDRAGIIKEGRRADLLILDRDINKKMVIYKGKELTN